MNEIRRARTRADFERFHQLLVVYENALPQELRHGSVPALEELERTHAEREAALLALSGDEVIGCVALRRRDDRTAIVMRLFVQPHARGRGAARALVKAAIDFAREHGYDRIVLDTHKGELPAAYALYLSMGFRECAAFDKVSYACPTFMELRLRNSTDGG